MIFDAFLAQRNASGQDALEAYDAALLDALSGEERHMAEILLIEDMHAGRRRAYRGLALLGSDAALHALITAFAQVDVPSDAHVRLCDALYLATGDETYLHALLDDVASEQPPLARDVVMVLAAMSPSVEVLKEVAHVIRQFDLDEATRALAVSTLMVCCGFPALPDDLSPARLQSERALMAATPATWNHVIEEIFRLARRRGYAVPCIPL